MFLGCVLLFFASPWTLLAVLHGLPLFFTNEIIVEFLIAMGLWVFISCYYLLTSIWATVLLGGEMFFLLAYSYDLRMRYKLSRIKTMTWLIALFLVGWGLQTAACGVFFPSLALSRLWMPIDIPLNAFRCFFL